MKMGNWGDAVRSKGVRLTGWELFAYRLGAAHPPGEQRAMLL